MLLEKKTIKAIDKRIAKLETMRAVDLPIIARQVELLAAWQTASDAGQFDGSAMDWPGYAENDERMSEFARDAWENCGDEGDDYPAMARRYADVIDTAIAALQTEKDALEIILGFFDGMNDEQVAQADQLADLGSDI